MRWLRNEEALRGSGDFGILTALLREWRNWQTRRT
jgi:hypothetical protein